MNNQNKKTEAIRRLLEAQGDSKDQISATLDIIQEQDKNERLNSLRSWIAVLTSAIALIVSILVAIFK